MCKNAQGTAVALMAAIEPTIKLFLQYYNVPADTQANIISSYNYLMTDITNWKSGTPGQDIIQGLNDFSAALQGLGYQNELLNIILAGVVAVIAVIEANSPAPTTTDTLAHEETQAMHQTAVAAGATAKVEALVPKFKRSIWHSPEGQYKDTWNKEVEAQGLDDSMKVS